MEKIKFRLEIQGAGHVQSLFISEDMDPIDTYSVTAGVDEAQARVLYGGNLSVVNRLIVLLPKDQVRQSDSVPVTHNVEIQTTSSGIIFSKTIHGLLIMDFNDTDGADLSKVTVSTNADFRTDVTLLAWSF